MSENMTYPTLPDESPIPVPSVDESWSQMRQQLDVHLPVPTPYTPATGHFNLLTRLTRLGLKAIAGITTAVVATTATLFFLLSSPHTSKTNHPTSSNPVTNPATSKSSDSSESTTPTSSISADTLTSSAAAVSSTTASSASSSSAAATSTASTSKSSTTSSSAAVSPGSSTSSGPSGTSTPFTSPASSTKSIASAKSPASSNATAKSGSRNPGDPTANSTSPNHSPSNSAGIASNTNNSKAGKTDHKKGRHFATGNYSTGDNSTRANSTKGNSTKDNSTAGNPTASNSTKGNSTKANVTTGNARADNATAGNSAPAGSKPISSAPISSKPISSTPASSAAAASKQANSKPISFKPGNLSPGKATPDKYTAKRSSSGKSAIDQSAVDKSVANNKPGSSTALGHNDKNINGRNINGNNIDGNNIDGKNDPGQSTPAASRRNNHENPITHITSQHAPPSLATVRPDNKPNSRSYADSSLRKLGSSTAKSSTPSKSDSKSAKNAKSLQRSAFVLTAGISEGKNFALGGRETPSYNANAKSNLLSDYIPAPYVQFFIGNRIYIRTAFYFNDPQYVRSQLLDSTAVDSLSSTLHPHSSNLQLKKLYYASIPLTIHYRVFDNLYLGAGIQYSSLKQAIGERKTTYLYRLNGSDSAYTTSSDKLSGDTTYKQFSKTDWRLLFQASYNWKRWTFGVQYQMSLSPYLTTAPYGVSSPNKNASFGCYLQYDLWQQRRKK